MKNGKRIVVLRRVTLSAVFVAVLVSLAFDSGLGTPSSFGIGEFFLLCPLGGIEAMVASRSFLPAAAISLAVVLLFALIFGRAWCAWGCPAPPIRKFFRRQPEGMRTSQGPSASHAASGPHAASAPYDASGPHAVSASHAANSPHAKTQGCASCSSDGGEAKSAFRRIRDYVAGDRRLWVLVGVLVITFIVGFPVFCLVCPIGLTFGTVSSLWHLFVDKQVTASVIVFPLALVIELVIYRKWCINLCPIAGLLNVFGRFAKLFRPRIDASTCLRYADGKDCSVCVQACAESISMHDEDAAQQLGECTRCGECVKMCPTNSISIEARPEEPLVRR